MTRLERLEARRLAVLEELGKIETLRKGSLGEQWFPVVREGKRTDKLRGPYYLWTYKTGKKTVSERIRGPRAVERARQHEANYKRFRELCREYEAVAQELGALEPAEEPEMEARKKKG